MTNWIDELKNISEFTMASGPVHKPDFAQEDSLYYNMRTALHENTLNSKQNFLKQGNVDLLRKKFEKFCDREYNYYLTKLNECNGKIWHTESFDFSHNYQKTDVQTDLAYCYDRGLLMRKNDSEDTSIFSIVPIFSNSGTHNVFFGATKTLLCDNNGQSQYAYVGFTRDNCKTYAFHQFFPESSIVSTLPEKCPVTGLKASYLFDFLNERYTKCMEKIEDISQNDNHSSSM